MEDLLLKFGISNKTIEQMEELCPSIKDLQDNELLEKIEILKDENCDDIQIKNIISSNAFYLDRSNTDIEQLINKLKEFGFDTLNLLFDGNPYILNLDAFEIENYIKNRENKGENLENIVGEMSSDPSLFQEI